MTPLNSIMAWLSSAPFLHAAGIAAIASLIGVGVVPVSEGLPILTGLIGLGINTTPTVGSLTAGVAPVTPVPARPAVPVPPAAPAPAQTPNA